MLGNVSRKPNANLFSKKKNYVEWIPSAWRKKKKSGDQVNNLSPPALFCWSDQRRWFWGRRGKGGCPEGQRDCSGACCLHCVLSTLLGDIPARCLGQVGGGPQLWRPWWNSCPGASDLEQVPRSIGSEQEVLVPRSSDASAVYSQAGVTAKAQPEFPPGPQSLLARPWRRTQCTSGDQPQAPITTFAARTVSGRETGKRLLGLHKEDFPRRSPVINLAGICFNTPSLLPPYTKTARLKMLIRILLCYSNKKYIHTEI